MRNYFKTSIILLTILISNASQANSYFGFDNGIDGITLSHNILTYHPFSRTFNDHGTIKKWNEKNGVTGIRINTSKNFGIGFAYGKNSYYEDMFILEADFKFNTNSKFISYGASLMLASGYDEWFEEVKYSGGLMPAVYTYGQLNYKDLHLKVGALNFMAIAIMVEYDIDFK